jgi:hypothetical protein
VSILADTIKRNDQQIAWEEKYVERVKFWQEVDLLIQEDQAAIDAASSSSSDNQQSVIGNVGTVVTNLPPPGDYATLSGNQTLYDAKGGKIDVVSGDFQLPSSIQLAGVVNGKVILPTGTRRSEYAKIRVNAAYASKAAGFMSMSEDMFVWDPGNEDENIFAPDFVPILALLHANIKHLFPNNKVKANSGYRWWNETKGLEYSMHEAGCAIDIGTRNPKTNAPDLSRCYQVADVAWELGLRSVFVGKTFVHIDLGPDGGGYKYDGVPKYRGPESH